MELLRSLLGPPVTEKDSRVELLEGLFGGVAQEDVSRFEQELATRITHQRNELLRLREVVDAKFEAAKRKGVRNPEAPSSQDTQNPAWSEYNLAKDAHKRAAALLKQQEKALKALQRFAATTGENFLDERKVVVQLRRAPVVELPAAEELSQLEEQYASQPELDEDVEGIPEFAPRPVPYLYVPRGGDLPSAKSLTALSALSWRKCMRSRPRVRPSRS